jgi:hypothetical protein
MSTFNPHNIGNAAPMGALAAVRVPSQAERDEVARVQRLQVRTNAAALATQLLASHAPDLEEWIRAAQVIARFILEDG